MLLRHFSFECYAIKEKENSNNRRDVEGAAELNDNILTFE